MSTLTERTGRFGAGALAIVTSILVVLSGFLVVPAAQAAEGPTITVTPAENLDPAVEQTLTVTGTGFVGDAATTKNGVYVLFGEKSVWSGGGPLVASGWITQGWVQARNIVDGAFTTTVKVPANTLDPAKEYHVATSAAHELSGTVRALDAFASVTVQQPAPVAVPTTTSLSASAAAVAAGDEVTFTATVAPTADGTVIFSDAGTPIGDAQPVVAGVATFATASLAVGSHAVTATFVPADPAAFVGSVSAETAVSVTEETSPEPVKASIEASVVGATEAGLQVSATVKNIVLRDAADVPDTGKADAGVYVGIIEKDRVAEYGSDAAAGAAQDFAYKMFIKDGAVTRDIPVPAAKLDRTKQYVAVTWLAHGMLNDSRYLGQVDLAVSDAQWDSVFGAPKASIEASVVGATEAGLQVSATVKNIVLRDAADVPDTGKADAGVYVGIIEKDRVAEYGSDAAAGAAQDFAYKMFIKDGAVTRDIPVPAAKLDRTKQYVAVTWLAHGMLNDSRYLGQVDLAVSDAQWDSVFGAPKASIEASVVGATEAGLQVSATVKNIVLRDAADVPDTGKADAGVYVGIIEKDRVAEYGSDAAAGAAQDFAYKMFIKDGAVTRDIPVPAAKLDRTKQYVAVTWLAHGMLNDSRYLGQVDLAVSDAQWDSVFPNAFTPDVRLFKADGVTPLDPAQEVNPGDEIVVRGTGFDPSSNVNFGRPPVTSGDPAGNYVVFGAFAQDWSPAGGVAGTQRVVADQRWAMTDETFVNIAPMYKPMVAGQRVQLTAAGTFEARLQAKDIPEGKTVPAGGSYGVFVYAAGTTSNASQEFGLRLNYKEERPTKPVYNPALSVFLADGTTKYTNQELKAGDKLVVRGTGFDPYANKPTNSSGGVPIPNSLPQGTFVVFGSFAETWQPSKGASAATRTMNKDSRKWALAKDTLDAIPEAFRETIRKEWVQINPATGSFETEITLNAPDEALAKGTYGIYTYAGGAGQTVNASQELSVPVNFKAAGTVDPEPSVTEGDLTWAFSTGWNAYVRGIANGTITASAGAKADAAGNTTYTQVKGGTYDAKTEVGSIHFAGTVRYVSEAHGFDIALRNPRITFTSKSAATLSIEVSRDDAAGVSAMKRINFATITPGELVKSEDGRLNWAGAKGVFASNLQIEAWEQYANKATAPLSFSYGAEAEVPVGPTEPTKPVKPKPTPKPAPKPRPVDTAQQAGSLSWGISSGFRDYTTGRIAKGSISTSGVGASGGAYLFPQASGGSWDKQAQTGSVQYSGVVTFSGHKGLMTETFSNPVITVTSATSGTISAGGRSFALDLGSASKSVGANGAVTWSGVPVSGAISGGGSAGGGTGGGSFAVDPLTFTVGSASRVSYGSTTQTDQKAARQAAATAPTTEGIRVITPADEIVPGGEIEFVAAGFEADERDILVVLYSDPIVLDEKAGASSVGEVRWIGTLPEDITPGEHTITLQGSKDAGAVIKVVKEKPKKKAPVVTQEEAAGDVTTQRVDAAAPVPADGPVWMWWVGAGALVALAVAMGVIVANQRRAAAAATVGSGTTPSA